MSGQSFLRKGEILQIDSIVCFLCVRSKQTDIRMIARRGFDNL